MVGKLAYRFLPFVYTLMIVCSRDGPQLALKDDPISNILSGAMTLSSESEVLSEEKDNQEKVYLYQNTPDAIDIKVFSRDEIQETAYTIVPEKRPLKQNPILCNQTNELYFICSDGISICSNSGTQYKTVVPGNYSAFTIVGESLYFCNGSDGNLYTSDLHGNNRAVIMKDPQLCYTRETTLQDVSFLVEEKTIYYVAISPLSGKPGKVKEYDIQKKTSADIIDLAGNTQMLWSTDEAVYFQHLPRLGQPNQYKELYKWDKINKKTSKILECFSAVALDDSIYYTPVNQEKIIKWENGVSTEIVSNAAPIVGAQGQKIYLSDMGFVPFDYYDVRTREMGAVADPSFYGTFLNVSLTDKSVGTNFY